MAANITFKKGPQANLPVLAEAEPAFTTDTKRLYIGTRAGNVEIGRTQYWACDSSAQNNVLYKTTCSALNMGVSTLNTNIGTFATTTGYKNYPVAKLSFVEGLLNFAGYPAGSYTIIDIDTETHTMTLNSVEDLTTDSICYATNQGSITVNNGDFIPVRIFITNIDTENSKITYDSTTEDIDFLEGSLKSSYLYFYRMDMTINSGSHVEGRNNMTLSQYGHVEGYSNFSSGSANHVEGAYNKATGSSSHAEGNTTQATGEGSHSEGNQTIAYASNSHAEGYKTSSMGDSSHSEGVNTLSGFANYVYSILSIDTNTRTIVLNDVAGITTNSIVSINNMTSTEYSPLIITIESVNTETKSIVYVAGPSVNNNYTRLYVFDTSTFTGSHAEGSGTAAVGQYSHAEGAKTASEGQDSHAEGVYSLSKGLASHSEGYQTLAEANYSHAEGQNSEAIGVASHAEGNLTFSSGVASHSEGHLTYALGDYSHAEGQCSGSGGTGSHSEGQYCGTGSLNSHAEGYATVAVVLTGATTTAISSIDEPNAKITVASSAGFSVGNVVALTGGVNATHNTPYVFTKKISAIDGNVITFTDNAALECPWTTMTLPGEVGDPTDAANHAEGVKSQATGKISHAEGFNTWAQGTCTHTQNNDTWAIGHSSTAIGKMNNPRQNYNNPTTFCQMGDAFFIGNGSTYLSNAFRVRFDGSVYSQSTYNSGGADYAEYFEWQDGNSQDEDRVGRFVKLSSIDTDKIEFATGSLDERVLGVVSAAPTVAGNSYSDQWHGMYLKDDFGRLLLDEENNFIINSEYDSELEYVGREERPEWSAVGFMGRVRVQDDGSCVPGGLCKPSANGVATTSESNGYVVLKRIASSVVEVLLK